MEDSNNHTNEINNLLNNAFANTNGINPLREIFENRLSELKISSNKVEESLNIDYRGLNGLLDGTLKNIDVQALFKIADFLEMPEKEFFSMFMEIHKHIYKDEFAEAKKRVFINNNFDLKALKKCGFIENTTDYKYIESRIINYFGYESIYDYDPIKMNVAFSKGVIEPKNLFARQFWLESAIDKFKLFDNPYEYDRKLLMDYFPQIRWHTTSVEYGLQKVIKVLYRLGITVIFQYSQPTVHLRGATMAVNGKPCIVITDYKGFYPTLWFGLIHELFHILFDWDDIKENNYHLSEDDDSLLIENELEADDFARNYLLPKEKIENVIKHINDHIYLSEYAKMNNVHPSFIYVFYAYDHGKDDRMAWGRAKRMNPNFNECTSKLDTGWSDSTIENDVKKLKTTIYF